MDSHSRPPKYVRAQLPGDLHEALRHESIRRCEPISLLINEAVAHWLQAAAQKRGVRK